MCGAEEVLRTCRPGTSSERRSHSSPFWQLTARSAEAMPAVRHITRPPRACLWQQVIAQYLVAKYKGRGPDLLPALPELAARASLITRVADLYLAPAQVCSWQCILCE